MLLCVVIFVDFEEGVVFHRSELVTKKEQKSKFPQVV